MIGLIAFDLDGTLVDTAAEIADTVNDVLQTEGLASLPEATIRDWIGRGAREVVARAYAVRAGIAQGKQRGDAGHLDTMMVAYARFHAARCGTRSRLFPDVESTLIALRALSIKLAVVTNKEESFARQLLEAHGILDFFDPIVGGDTLPTRKPDPAPLRHCLEVHGIPPGRALLVGDSELDVRTARAAGVRSVVVPYGYNGGKAIASCEPDLIIATVAELLNLVRL
jgi:phosphoglycolate phosphatase